MGMVLMWLKTLVLFALSLPTLPNSPKKDLSTPCSRGWLAGWLVGWWLDLIEIGGEVKLEVRRRKEEDWRVPDRTEERAPMFRNKT